MESTTLYTKTHNVTGLKYFGKWCLGKGKHGDNVYDYRGSGKWWKRHIQKHGYDVTTEVIGTYTDKDELTKTALAFSHDHNIVESTEWANLKAEDGLNGGSTSEVYTPEMRKKMSVSAKARAGAHTSAHLNTPEGIAKMRKPKKIRYENCEHCGEKKKWSNVEKHEETCWMNPKNARECVICASSFHCRAPRTVTCSYECRDKLISRTKKNA